MYMYAHRQIDSCFFPEMQLNAVIDDKILIPITHYMQSVINSLKSAQLQFCPCCVHMQLGIEIVSIHVKPQITTAEQTNS